MLSSVVLIALGWVQIRKKHVRRHRRLMLWGSVLGVLFFISYVVKSLVIGDTMFGGPAKWHAFYLVFLQIHVFLATVAAVLGVITLRYAMRARFSRHRRVAPWTAVLWFIAAGTGLLVYLTLYVFYPPGGTANLVNTVHHLLH